MGKAGWSKYGRYQADNEEQVEMAGMQVDSVTNCQRERAGELVICTEGLIR